MKTSLYQYQIWVQKNLESCEFAYHIWDQIRVCRNDENNSSFTVFMREYGLVQDAGQDMINVFTTIELSLEDELLQSLLVSEGILYEVVHLCRGN